MITLATADKALKNVYLGAVTQQLNVNANPLLSKIRQSSQGVWGKEIHKVVSAGVNGGFGACTEDGALPKAASSNYMEFVLTLKNLYGKIEITDKAVRASQSSSGAFVNLLNAEMESLIKSSSFNLGRMLYGDGTGLLAFVTAHTANTAVISVDETRNFIEGQMVEIAADDDGMLANSLSRVIKVDHANKKITLDKTFSTAIGDNYGLFIQGSFTEVGTGDDKEITGLEKVLSSSAKLYGVPRSTNGWLQCYIKDLKNGGYLTEDLMQTIIDDLDMRSGSDIDFIACSSSVRRAFQAYMNTYRRYVDVMKLESGYKAISFNGIPLVVDRFVPEQTAYFLNTKDFTLHQLCDWEWLEGDDGKILKQNPGYATYSATLVKYADLICDKPSGQASVTRIKTDMSDYNPFPAIKCECSCSTTTDSGTGSGT